MNALTQPIKINEAADLLKLTTRRVQQLVTEGWIKKTAGKYTIVGCVHGYIDFLHDEERRTTKSAADSRLRDRRADEIELRYLERKKSLLNEAKTESLGIVDEVIGSFKADLMALPARVTSDLELRKKIEAAINDAFREVTERVERHASDTAEDSNAFEASF